MKFSTSRDDNMTSAVADLSGQQFVVLTPCYNDWEALAAVLPDVDRHVATSGIRLHVVIVDDCSTLARPVTLFSTAFSCVDSVRVVSLLGNVGHQRAICVGLAYLASDSQLRGATGVVVMDADGEDAPRDVTSLLLAFAAASPPRAVFAKRVRRSEGLVFSVFYQLYRQAHRLLTGIPVQIGNFSVLPMYFARRLSVTSDLWNHYAAAAVHARLPIEQVATSRATRLAGSSSMNFVSLVSHGLAAMSVFADRIGVRALVATLATILVLAGGLVAVVGVRLYTTLAIPGWATTAAGVLAVLLTQALLLALAFAFLIHLGRSSAGFLPARDHQWYIDRVETVWSRNA